jgi:hypothetical protein
MEYAIKHTGKIHMRQVLPVVDQEQRHRAWFGNSFGQVHIYNHDRFRCGTEAARALPPQSSIQQGP